VSEEVSRQSVRELTGGDAEFEGLKRFYGLARVFAEEVWGTMLEPLQGKAELARRFDRDERSREAWRSLVEEPLGLAIERHVQDDLLRGVVFTDGKIGLFTEPHDPTLLQNRCFLYHLIGNGTGEWRVPVGGMGQLVNELMRVAGGYGVEMLTDVRIMGVEFEGKRTVEFEVEGEAETIEAGFVLVNFGANVLAELLGRKHEADATHEGSVLKVNMLLKRLPRLRAGGVAGKEAFAGTFHIDEGYEEMKGSYREAAGGRLPGKIPCEIYCHTLTDDSILGPGLRQEGFQTLTLFALDTPWRLFREQNEAMRGLAMRRCLEGLNSYLEEPVETCLAVAKHGELCIEAKSPVDIEEALGHYQGNIFHGALTFPFAESPEAIGSWGVETEFERVYLCGSSARRGGAVSGIPGHNAAMKVLEMLKQ
jgi:phytoene dehydrogenase-like protein